MYAKEYRLRTKKIIESLDKEKGARSPFFILKSRANRLNVPRVVIVVSKKVSNKAVVRNKARRRLSEIIKDCVVNMSKRDIKIITLPRIVGASFDEIKEEFLDTARKEKLL